MKNIIILFTLIFVLLANCPAASAKDRGKGKPIGRDSRRREATQQKRGKKPKDKPAPDNDQQDRKVQDGDLKEDANKPRPERKPKAQRKQEPNRPPAKDKQKAKAKGKTHQQQLKAIDDQITHEKEKHLERKARLERISQLAEEENNQETIDRVNKLIEKEQHRHDRKITKLQQRKQKIQQRAETRKEKEQPEPRDVNE
jgi:hypothetical protein